MNGGAGNDILDGGAGFNSVIYGGPSGGYSLSFDNGSLVATDTDSSNGSDGVDILIGNFESVGFSNGAEVLRATGEFRVPTVIHYQAGSVVAGLMGGGFVVAFFSLGQDGTLYGIYARRYAATGQALGDEFRVSNTTDHTQSSPTIAALAGGGFVISWKAQERSSITGWDVHARRYDASGAAQGGEFRLSSTTSKDQEGPVIASLADGGFVATWYSARQNGGWDDIYAQRFDAHGAMVGAEFKVNTDANNRFEGSPAIAALAGGGFMVVWHDSTLDGSDSGIFGQRYDAEGLAQGGQFQVNSTTANEQSEPVIAALAANAGYVVAWRSDLQDGSGFDVYAQRYDAAGVAQGAEFRVNSSTANHQYAPTITALTGGGFVVSWQGLGQGGDADWGIYAQRYDGAGVAQGAEFRVNSTVVFNQEYPSITALADGGFLVSWQIFSQTGVAYGIYAQRYDADGVKVLNRILGDDNANTLIWTQAGSVALMGAAGDDTLSANAGDDSLDGGAGDDSLSGGAGVDTASYDSAGSAVSVSLAIALAQNTDGAGSDILAGIENLMGSRHADTLGGDAGNNLLAGRTGNDTLVGGAGNDTLDGNGEVDTASYATSTGAVTANLVTGVAADGLAGTDQLQNIENLSGSDFNDSLTGDGGDNQLTGGLGNDNLAGGDGNDSLNGGAGNDILDGGAGDNRAMYAGLSSGYSLGFDNGRLVVTDTDSSNGSEGVDTLRAGIEGLAFNNGAEVLQVNGEFKVNAVDSSYPYSPAAVGLTGGGFVVAFDTNSGIAVQRYGANGQSLGGEFRVNGAALNEQQAPVITALAGGGFVVGWQEGETADAWRDVYAQCYDASGVAQGAAITLNSSTPYDQSQLAIAALAGGGFVATWTSSYQDGLSSGIYAQRFDANGALQGAEFKVHLDSANRYEFSPAVAALANGGFMVIWCDDSSLAGRNSIYAQRFDADGLAQGSQFKVNSSAAELYHAPAITALAGNAGYVVAWTSESGRDVTAQRFDASGLAQGSEFSVNSTTRHDFAPTITALAGGGFVVSWAGFAQSGDTDWGIYAQRYDGDGVAQGGKFRVNSTTYYDQQTPSIAALSDGGFLVTWHSGHPVFPDYGSRIYAQRYDANGVKVLNQITGDGNANTLNWAQADGVALMGVAGNDTLSSSAGDDTLDGGAGDDAMSGGVGNDRLLGGVGQDTASYANATGGVVANLTTGVASGGAGADTLNEIEHLLGSDFHDNLAGNSLANRIEGGAGNDTLRGAAGEDTVDGGAGDDSLDGGTHGANGDTASYGSALAGVTASLTTKSASGSAGSDILNNFENLTGSPFADMLTGNIQANRLAGGAGADTLNGGAGADTLVGGDGNDQYTVDSALDVITESNADSISGGVDLVLTALATYALGANLENLRLTSAGAANGFGNSLANLLIAGAGDNSLDGGTGNDTASYALAGASVTASLTSRSATGGSGADILQGFENLLGSNYSDSLIGNTLANKLDGAGGADTLNGGAGVDTLIGGSGSDLFYVDNGGDVVIEIGSDGLSGRDSVYASVSYTLGANLETLKLNSAANINGTGNDGNNTLISGAGANIMDGASGIDTASYAYTSGGVNVTLAIQGVSQNTGNGGVDTLIGFENLTGSNYNDTLAGDAGDNLIEGGVGTDTVTYAAAAGAVNASLTTRTASGQGTDTLLRIENLIGSAQADTLTGSSIANQLSGGDGADTLTGKAGADTLTGGAGADTFDLNSAGESRYATRDVVTDFNAGEGDKIDLSSIDANTGLGGNQAFTQLDSGASFDGSTFTAAGRLFFDTTAHILYGNVDADSPAEFAIELVGVVALDVSAVLV